MGWKRFQNGLSATIAHPAPPGEKNPTFPFAGKFPPFAVLLATASLSLGSSFLPAGWESVANPPHSRSAGPWRRFGAERCRETPAQLPCGAVATLRRRKLSRSPHADGLRGRGDAPARGAVRRGMLATGRAAHGSGPRLPRTAISFP